VIGVKRNGKLMNSYARLMELSQMMMENWESTSFDDRIYLFSVMSILEENQE